MASTNYRYALRIDSNFSEVRDLVVAKSFTVFAVREVADQNEHWHFYLEGSIKLNSFRASLKRAVPALVGNGRYSVKQCDADVEKYFRYCLKGEGNGAGYEIAWRTGLLWTDDRFEELHQAYWDENEKLKKKLRSGPIVDSVVDECKRTAVDWNDRVKISELYIRELVRRKKPINKFVIKSQCLLVSSLLCPDDSGIINLASEVWL